MSSDGARKVSPAPLDADPLKNAEQGRDVERPAAGTMLPDGSIGRRGGRPG